MLGRVVLRKPFLLTFLSLLATGACVCAQGPELSADEPIEFDAANKVLLAAGNATFVDKDVTVVADRIRYFQDQNLVLAEGNVQVTQRGVRLISDRIEYDTETRRFKSGRFRAGMPPVYAEGAAFEGVPSQITLEDVRLYYREPDAGSVGASAGKAVWTRGESVAAEEVKLRLAWLPAIPLPGFERDLDAEGLQFNARAGYRSSLGAYLQTETLFPVGTGFAAGANFDIFTKRGVLIGPSFRYERNGPNPGQRARVEFSSGWIRDSDDDERGVDFRGEPIDEDRYFVEFGTHLESRGLDIVARTTVLSDTEVERDFRSDLFNRNQFPDSFVEASYLLENVVVSAFVRANPNSFYGMVERLPELRIEKLSTPLGETGFTHSADLRFLSYRGSFVGREDRFDNLPDYFPALPGYVEAAEPGPDGIVRAETDPVQRFDAWYGLRRTLRLARGVTLTPMAGGLYSYYDSSAPAEGEITPSDDPIHRVVGELGADLRIESFGEWDFSNARWDIKGLRHYFTPVVYYRWHPGAEDQADEILAIDSTRYTPSAPLLDLHQARDLDTLRENHLVRFGLENQLTTRGANGGGRTLLEFDLYQDLVLDPESFTGEDSWDATYLDLHSSPARWLEFGFGQKFRTEGFHHEHTRLYTRLRSADVWELTFEANYLADLVEQYAASGIYRLTPDFALVGETRYDRRLDAFTRTRVGVRQRVGNNWELEYYLTFTDGSTREDDWHFGVRVYVLDF